MDDDKVPHFRIPKKILRKGVRLNESELYLLGWLCLNVSPSTFQYDNPIYCKLQTIPDLIIESRTYEDYRWDKNQKTVFEIMDNLMKYSLIELSRGGLYLNSSVPYRYRIVMEEHGSFEAYSDGAWNIINRIDNTIARRGAMAVYMFVSGNMTFYHCDTFEPPSLANAEELKQLFGNAAVFTADELGRRLKRSGKSIKGLLQKLVDVEAISWATVVADNNKHIEIVTEPKKRQLATGIATYAVRRKWFYRMIQREGN